jgi:cobalamin biosynthesis Mg chelatase CobN
VAQAVEEAVLDNIFVNRCTHANAFNPRENSFSTQHASSHLAREEPREEPREAPAERKDETAARAAAAPSPRQAASHTGSGTSPTERTEAGEGNSNAVKRGTVARGAPSVLYEAAGLCLRVAALLGALLLYCCFTAALLLLY